MGTQGQYTLDASAVAHARYTAIGASVTPRSHSGNTVNVPTQDFRGEIIGAFWMYLM